MKNLKFIILLVAVLAINSLFGLVNSVYLENNYLTKSVFKLILALVVILLLRQYRFSFKIPSTKNIILSLVFALGLIVFAFNSLFRILKDKGFEITGEKIFIFLLSCLTVGLFEELLFRKFTFEYVKKSMENASGHIWKAIIISSLIFAFAHSSNVFSSNVVSLSVINQIVFAFGIGIILQALFIRFKNIIIVVAIHGIINFFGSYKHHLSVKNITQEEDVYTMSDFWITLITLVIFNIVLILISRLILRKELKTG